MQWLHKLSIRERIEFLITLTIVLGAGCYQVVWIPLSQTMSQLEHRLRVPINNRSMVKQFKGLDHLLKQQAERLLSPEKMESLVHTLTTQENGLSLIHLQSQPANLLMSCGSEVEGYGLGTLFRHDIKIELKGDYPTILNHLHTLQRQTKSIYVDYFSYKTTQHPQALLTLHLHTLSLNQSLFSE